MTAAAAAVIGFITGVVVALLNAHYARNNERKKHVAQLASEAFVDVAKAAAESSASMRLLSLPNLTEEDRSRWQARQAEAEILYASAKGRLAAYGNRRAVELMAQIERGGGLGVSPDTVVAFTRAIMEIRAEMSIGQAPREGDVRDLVFGVSHE